MNSRHAREFILAMVLLSQPSSSKKKVEWVNNKLVRRPGMDRRRQNRRHRQNH